MLNLQMMFILAAQKKKRTFQSTPSNTHKQIHVQAKPFGSGIHGNPH